MVTENELRIGLWFMDYQNRAFQWQRQHFIELEIAFISEFIKEPVRLSPEILEACGFHTFDSGDIKTWTKTWGRNGVFIVQDAPEYNAYACVFGQGYRTIVSELHRLQNIFHAHTTQELEVNLPATVL
jgi:hypothetical protein